MKRKPESLIQARSMLDAFEAEGVKTPRHVAEVLTTVDSIPAAAELQQLTLSRLEAAVRSGAAEDIADIIIHTGAAFASKDTMNLAIEKAEAIALAEVLSAYPFGTAYERFAELFNEQAALLVDALAVVDADADPDTLNPEELPLWQSVPKIAERLDDLLAKAMGCFQIATGLTISQRPDWKLCLITNRPEDTKESKTVMDAWRFTHGGRGGKWAALIRAGATLQAPETVNDNYAAWRERHAAQTEQAR